MAEAKLSASQVRTLAALRQDGGWTGSNELTVRAGSVSSLPRLMALGLIEERPHPARQYRRQWRLIELRA